MLRTPNAGVWPRVHFRRRRGVIAFDMAKKKKPVGRVNINTATTAELMTLPHVGPVIAARIVAYRKKYGRFDEIEEIKEVDGIGEDQYPDLKDRITLD